MVTAGQSVSLFWNKAHIWRLRQDYFSCSQTVAGLLMWGALFEETYPPKRRWNFNALHGVIIGHDSAVDIATGLGLNDRGGRARVPVGARFSSSLHHPYWVLGLRSHLMVIGGVFRGNKADHSPPKYRRGQEYLDLHIHSPIRLHGVVLN
jgi:hypothetical protein